MFFQSIYQMLAAGTDLCINIRKINGNLSVIVMPRRTNLKDEAGQLIVPLVLDGTPVELDEQFLQAVTTPLQKAQGILVNLESFEKQAQQATTQSKAAKTVNDKESKEIREKREKMEKLLKKSDEAVIVGKYSEATMWLKQARALATPDKQKDIDVQMQEVQKKATEGSLFAEATPQTQSVPQQPSINGISKGQQAEGQMQMFPTDPERQTTPQQQQPMYKQVTQPTPQPLSPPQILQQQPKQQVAPQQQSIYQPMPQPLPQPQVQQPIYQQVPQAYQPETVQPQPMYGQYYQQPTNGFSDHPIGQQPIGQPQMYIEQPGGQPQQMQQWQQTQAMPQQPQAPAIQVASGNTGREYQSQPQPAETLCFDKDDESDRALLREDPYVEYLDFPKENRMKDEAQIELICC